MLNWEKQAESQTTTARLRRSAGYKEPSQSLFNDCRVYFWTAFSAAKTNFPNLRSIRNIYRSITCREDFVVAVAISKTLTFPTSADTNHWIPTTTTRLTQAQTKPRGSGPPGVAEGVKGVGVAVGDHTV